MLLTSTWIILSNYFPKRHLNASLRSALCFSDRPLSETFIHEYYMSLTPDMYSSQSPHAAYRTLCHNRLQLPNFATNYFQLPYNFTTSYNSSKGAVTYTLNYNETSIGVDRRRNKRTWLWRADANCGEKMLM